MQKKLLFFALLLGLVNLHSRCSAPQQKSLLEWTQLHSALLNQLGGKPFQYAPQAKDVIDGYARRGVNLNAINPYTQKSFLDSLKKDIDEVLSMHMPEKTKKEVQQAYHTIWDAAVKKAAAQPKPSLATTISQSVVPAQNKHAAEKKQDEKAPAWTKKHDEIAILIADPNGDNLNEATKTINEYNIDVNAKNSSNLTLKNIALEGDSMSEALYGTRASKKYTKQWQALMKLLQ